MPMPTPRRRKLAKLTIIRLSATWDEAKQAENHELHDINRASSCLVAGRRVKYPGGGRRRHRTSSHGSSRNMSSINCCTLRPCNTSRPNEL